MVELLETLPVIDGALKRNQWFIQVPLLFSSRIISRLCSLLTSFVCLFNPVTDLIARMYFLSPIMILLMKQHQVLGCCFFFVSAYFVKLLLGYWPLVFRNGSGLICKLHDPQCEKKNALYILEWNSKMIVRLWWPSIKLRKDGRTSSLWDYLWYDY